jgi:hypothetical protein
MRRVGVLMSFPEMTQQAKPMSAFRVTLTELGWVEGRKIDLEASRRAQRYRLNAAQCLTAAEQRESDKRSAPFTRQSASVHLRAADCGRNACRHGRAG